MKFLTIQNGDTKKLGAVIVWNEMGKVVYTTMTKWYEETLASLLQSKNLMYEYKVDERTIGKRQITIKSPEFLTVLKSRVLPPYVPYVMGDLKNDVTQKDAVEKVWKMFSKTEHQDIVEV